jgi:hypothetical protein
MEKTYLPRKERYVFLCEKNKSEYEYRAKISTDIGGKRDYVGI